MDNSLPKIKNTLDIFKPLRRWIEGIPVENDKTAHRIVSIIPATHVQAQSTLRSACDAAL